MHPPHLGSLGFAALLVVLNGWFVMAEFSLVRVRQTRLKELATGGNTRAKLALRITQNLDAYLASAQLGITLASLALGWVGEPVLARLLSPIFSSLPGSVAFTHGVAIFVAFFIITFLHVVIGEQAPKMFAIQKSEQLALACARPLHLFYLLSWPLMRLLDISSTSFVRMFGMKPVGEGGEAHSEEELRMIVHHSHRQGILDKSTRDLLDNVLDYTERVAREIMTARPDVVCLDVNMPVEESIQFALDKEYTRYPLLDPKSDRVIGFIHIKDLMALVMGRRRVTTLGDIARQPVFVPETVDIDKVRQQLQARKTHFGVVVDEFGDFTGIVTLEDLLEELVGEIQDELDTEQPKILRRPDGSSEVDGRILADTAAKKLGLTLTEESANVDTLGGYVFALLGRAPVPGDAVVVGEHRLEVLKVDELRIERLKVARTTATPGTSTPPDKTAPRAAS